MCQHVNTGFYTIILHRTDVYMKFGWQDVVLNLIVMQGEWCVYVFYEKCRVKKLKYCCEDTLRVKINFSRITVLLTVIFCCSIINWVKIVFRKR